MATTVLTSCKEEDPCECVSCLNGGTCDNGTCNCATGYEGSDCGTEMRAKFVASYNVTERCTSGNYTYTISISNSATGAANVCISNSAGVGATVVGTVNGTAITIANQTVDVQGTSVTFSGSGQLNGNIMTLSYTLSANGVSDPCTATCTKQ